MFSISPSSFGLGAIFGGGIGVFATRRFLTEKLRAEIMEQSEKEVDSMREHYERKEVALKLREERRTAEELANEMGYSVKVEADQEENVRVLRPPVPVYETNTPPVEPEVTVEDLKPQIGQSHMEWDFKREVSKRSGTKPYVIHHSEMQELEGFEQVSYIYYPVDNVLVDEDGQLIGDVAETIGGETLDLFGHGSEDPNVVFVRNNALRLHIEVQNLPGRSYSVDVLGLSDDNADQ